MRKSEWQTEAKLTEGFDDGLRQAKLDYVDLWRITCYWQPHTNHTEAHEEAICEALDKAKKAGKARFGGLSTHKHDWAIRMMERYRDSIDVVVVPYTAGSKNAHQRVMPGGDAGWKAEAGDVLPQDKSMVSLIDAVKKNEVGWFGIKPFASGSVFRARGAVVDATKEADDLRARQTLRYVLCNDALTAPIPGLITTDQVANAAQAVRERREFDLAEQQQFDRMVDEMWASLPRNYEWLRREWEWV
jgi:aryl-alcohol dehydrogenase-like predicted oxidoreductase